MHIIFTFKLFCFLPNFSNSQTSISNQKLSTNEDVTIEDRKLAALALTAATDEGCVLSDGASSSTPFVFTGDTVASPTGKPPTSPSSKPAVVHLADLPPLPAQTSVVGRSLCFVLGITNNVLPVHITVVTCYIKY